MDVVSVTTKGENTLLAGIRKALDTADAALLCVAFVRSQGIHLLSGQLERLGSSARLLTTTAFQESTEALARAHALGVEVSLLNPSSGTYHPKVYLTRRGQERTIVLGSPNLTGGLINNIEAAVVLRGSWQDEPIRATWEWAEELWQARTAWTPAEAATSEAGEEFEPLLKELIAEAVRETGGLFHTLGANPRPNYVTELTATGVYMRTESSEAKGLLPQFIPAWMLGLAWDYLRAHGQLSNAFLLAKEGLNVKRSSAVCAILARLPGVGVRLGTGIVLEWRGPVSNCIFAMQTDPTPNDAKTPKTS